jgi:hypothetical protein
MVGGAFNDPSLTTILLPATDYCFPQTEQCQFYQAMWTRQEVTNVTLAIDDGEALIGMAAAKIENGKSGMGGVKEEELKGKETRPKNIQLVYIIKVA